MTRSLDNTRYGVRKKRQNPRMRKWVFRHCSHCFIVMESKILCRVKISLRRHTKLITLLTIYNAVKTIQTHAMRYELQWDAIQTPNQSSSKVHRYATISHSSHHTSRVYHLISPSARPPYPLQRQSGINQRLHSSDKQRYWHAYPPTPHPRSSSGVDGMRLQQSANLDSDVENCCTVRRNWVGEHHRLGSLSTYWERLCWLLHLPRLSL